jgi:DNA-binding transcriptional ArsR family regulator
MRGKSQILTAGGDSIPSRLRKARAILLTLKEKPRCVREVVASLEPRRAAEHEAGRRRAATAWRENSATFKRKLVERMLLPQGRRANKLSEEVGIGQPTLSRWLPEAVTLEPVTKRRKAPAPKNRPVPRCARQDAAAADTSYADWTPIGVALNPRQRRDKILELTERFGDKFLETVRNRV